MKIGLVGYKGSGKSTLFAWLTGVKPELGLSRGSQAAMAAIPEPRVDALGVLYHAKKLTFASLEIVDTPGLNRDHEGSAARLAAIREASCLVLVAAAFDGSDPAADARSFSEDLLLADMEVVSNRIAKVEDTMRKPLPKPEREQYLHEEQTLKLVLAAMESGKPMRAEDMTDAQAQGHAVLLPIDGKAVDGDRQHRRRREGPAAAPPGDARRVPAMAVPIGLEWELSRMSPEDRAEFEREMGAGTTDRGHLIRTMLDVSGQMLFLTAGEKECRKLDPAEGQGRRWRPPGRSTPTWPAASSAPK